MSPPLLILNLTTNPNFKVYEITKISERNEQIHIPHLRHQKDFRYFGEDVDTDRDYDAEWQSADERREHRRMAEGFGNIQKIVDEEMDEGGSDMCHILKLVAMAIFSQRGGSELGP